MKVRFRRVQEKDLRRLNEIVNDPQVARYLSVAPPVSMKSTREHYRKTKKNRNGWYSILVDNEIAGSTSLDFKPRSKQAHVAIFGIALAREYWGVDLGDLAIEFIKKEARKKGVKKLDLGVVVGNKRAVKLYKKHGFKREGIKKKDFKLGGKYHDMMIMGCWLG